MNVLACATLLVLFRFCSYKFQVAGACDAGFFGPYCNETCGYCLKGSTCDSETGNCPEGCESGVTGIRCDEACPVNYWGTNCSLPCGKCLTFYPCNAATGACQSGLCAAGYQGETCSAPCANNTWGPGCNQPCGNCLTYIPCDNVNGTCRGGCQPGWLEPNCDTQNTTQGPQGPCCDDGFTRTTVKGLSVNRNVSYKYNVQAAVWGNDSENVFDVHCKYAGPQGPCCDDGFTRTTVKGLSVNRNVSYKYNVQAAVWGNDSENVFDVHCKYAGVPLLWFIWLAIPKCDSQLIQNPCLGIKSCGDCIAKEPHCGWCADKVFDRCDLLETSARGCSKANSFSETNPPPDPEVSSPKCNQHGTFECGQCTCYAGYYGRTCELGSLQRRGDQSPEACIDPHSASNLVCSGRGDCIQGFCECYPRRSNSVEKYSGQYCQCDDYSCYYHNNQLCGGNGKCVCGNCMCNEGYEGESCGCPLSNASCLTSNGKICNGVGECQCGVCRCDPHSSYRGPTCEECPTCPGKCHEEKNCAVCVGFNTGPLTKEECEENCRHVTIVKKLGEEPSNGSNRLHMCQFLDDSDDCRYFFTYEYVENNKVHVEVQTTKECPAPVVKGGKPDGGANMLQSQLTVICLTILMLCL